MQISEQAVVLNKSMSLVGIFARPAGGTELVREVAVVILNTGIIHRVGHNRMYVTLSRALASSGHMVVRFDFSGIGDSGKPNDDLSPLESSLSDLKDVLDWLQNTKNISHIVLIGLCMGADHAVRYAAIDPRVVGVVLMDPSIPPTFRYFRDYLWDRLLNARSWFNIAFGKSRIRWMLVDRLMAGLFKNWQPRYPALIHPKLRWQFEQIYQASVDRNVKFLVVLTAGGFQTYAEQLVDALPGVNFSNLLRSEFFRDCDHVFRSEASRMRLQKLILEWLGETCSSGHLHEDAGV
jgi:pimeloyl-ACP methyl ester carboxylesterase